MNDMYDMIIFDIILFMEVPICHSFITKLRQFINMLLLWSLRSFTWVLWEYLPITDILCRPHFHRFLSSFLCCCLFSKCKIHFFILVFSDPTLFSLSFPVLLSLSSTFYLYPVLLCISSTFSFILSCLSFTFLLPSILLWFSLFTT